jgi:leucyl aminopeptidase
MQSLLPEINKHNKNIRITHSTGSPGSKALAGIDQLLLILPKRVPAGLWRKVQQGNKIRDLMRRRNNGSVPAAETRLNNKRQTRVIVGTITDDTNSFDELTLGRKLVSAATTEKAGVVGIWVLGFESKDQQRIAKHVAAAALAAGFPMPEFKTKETPASIKSIRVIGLQERADFARQSAEASGNNLARWLTALPPNKLDAVSYTKLLQDLAKQQGWQFKKFATTELARLGAGAFLAVAQGNENDSAAIVRLRYRPDSKTMTANLSLVGKGIIFDTGGTNLKPFTSMLDMHTDMGGSAVAVGTLLAISSLDLPYAVDCWLAITENRTGPEAYKSQDVVQAANGKTIQTIHTDAEGRMALADTLVFASREKPGLIIDYATLTGSCVNAVTTRYSGIFTNRPDWHPVLKRTGRDSGERVWPFPVDKEFLSEIKSETADLKQCATNGGGDHILAAVFLNEFIENDVPWVHIDLSACARKGGLANISTEITGFGVRYTMSLILDQHALDKPDWM